jgi:hypothetical protein
MKRTPEPWEVEKDMELFGRYTILGSAKEQTAYIDAGYEASEEEGIRREDEDAEKDEGNRLLIQVAPGLLKLVEEAFERFTNNDMQPPNDRLRDWLERAANVFYKINPDSPGREGKG